MKLEDRYAGAPPAFFELCAKMEAIARDAHVAYVIAAANELLSSACVTVATKHPERRKEVAAALRRSADWIEFMPAALMTAVLDTDAVEALIQQQKAAR